MNSKISILLIGPFPEPLSGVSIANQVVNEVLSEDSQFEVDLINTSYSRFDEEIGKFSIKKAFFYLTLNLNILKEKIRNNQNSLLGISNQFLNNNKNNFLSYSNRVNSASKLLESLSYKSVIKRGFAVIRNSSNKVIGKKTDIIRDNKLSIETKFGIIKAEIKDEQ